jgi:hypothetical protein
VFFSRLSPLLDQPFPLPIEPLEAHGQRDISETLGDKPRSHHEPIAVIGDDSLWLVSRSQQSACSGYWVERRAFAPGGSNWRQCLAVAAGVTRNPTALSPDRGSGLFLVGFDVLGTNESWWLKRYDPRGVEDTAWDKSFSAGTKISRSYGLRLDPAGSVYIFGETGEIDLRGTFGRVRKFLPDGREQLEGWDKRFPNAGERRPTMAVVGGAVDSNGGLSVLLNLYNTCSLRKFDRDGQELWRAELPGLRDPAISADMNGDLYVYGVSGYPDKAWIKKLRADGSAAWERSFALGQLSSTLAVAFDSATNVFVAGYGSRVTDKSSPWSSYWWIKKLGADGGELTGWDKSIGEQGANKLFTLHVNSRGELLALGTGHGWQFSGSRLERWWGR